MNRKSDPWNFKPEWESTGGDSARCSEWQASGKHTTVVSLVNCITLSLLPFSYLSLSAHPSRRPPPTRWFFFSSCNSLFLILSFVLPLTLYLFNLPLGFPWNAVFICFCVSPNFPTPLDPHSRPIWPTLRRLAMWPIPKRTGVVRYVEPECLECGLRRRLDADRVALSPVLLAFFEAREMLHQPDGFPTFVMGRLECHH